MNGNQSALIAQYLNIISLQQTEINQKEKEIARLKNVNADLLRQKKLYKLSAIEWKARFEDLAEQREIPIQKSSDVVPATVREALRIYESMNRI